MEYKLTVPERIHVLNLLPKEGSYVTLKIIRDMQKKIGFTADEVSDYAIQEIDGSVTWNELGNIESIFNLVDVEAEIIRKELRNKDTNGNLNMGTFSVYEKFMC